MTRALVKWMFAGLLLAIMPRALSAQEQQQDDTKRLAELSRQMEGTYQVQVVNSRQYFSMPLNIFDSIQAQRHKTETRYLQVSENIRIMIPSQQAILSPGFKPLQRVVYLTENK